MELERRGRGWRSSLSGLLHDEGGLAGAEVRVWSGSLSPGAEGASRIRKVALAADTSGLGQACATRALTLTLTPTPPPPGPVFVLVQGHGQPTGPQQGVPEEGAETALTCCAGAKGAGTLGLGAEDM